MKVIAQYFHVSLTIKFLAASREQDAVDYHSKFLIVKQRHYKVWKSETSTVHSFLKSQRELELTRLSSLRKYNVKRLAET